MTEQKQTAKPELLPVSRFNDWIPYPSVGSLRQLIFYNTNNFYDCVVRKIGKRLYLHIPSFYEWVEETNRKEAV